MNSTSLDPTVDPSLQPISGDAALAAGGEEGFEHYRALSGAAVVSMLLGVASAVSLLDFWALKVIPFLGIVAGLGALRRIRMYPGEFSGRNVALAGVATSAMFLITGSAWSAYSYAVEVPEGYQRIDYSMLKHPDESRKNFVSPAAQALNGKKVFLKGFMFPTQHEKGVTRFVLCRDNGDCCFGKEPPMSDMVYVQLKSPLQTTYKTSIRRVAGVFRVAGSHSSDVNKDVLYQLEADYIK